MCVQCGGKVARVARAGRMGICNGVELEIPAHIELMECSGCHEIFFDLESAKIVDAALELLIGK